MAIPPRPEQEQVVGRAIQAGLIEEADDVVAIGVETVRQRLEALLMLDNPSGLDEWSRQLHEWICSHPSTAPLLSDEAMSRDSIFGTRGQ